MSVTRVGSEGFYVVCVDCLLMAGFNVNHCARRFESAAPAHRRSRRASLRIAARYVNHISSAQTCVRRGPHQNFVPYLVIQQWRVVVGRLVWCLSRVKRVGGTVLDTSMVMTMGSSADPKHNMS